MVAQPGAFIPAVDAGRKSKVDIELTRYERVAASQTGQTLGASGAIGDYLDGILIIPATTGAGNVILLDGNTSMTIFAGGETSVADLAPFYVPLGIRSISGAWSITTGADVSVIATGRFS